MWASTKELFRSWKVRFGASIAIVIAFFSAVSFLSSLLDDTASLWQKLEFAYTYAATPWLGVAILLASLFLTASGVRDITGALERGNLVDQEAAARETQVRNGAVDAVKAQLAPLLEEATKRTHLISTFKAAEDRVRSVEGALEAARVRLKSYESVIGIASRTADGGHREYERADIQRLAECHENAIMGIRSLKAHFGEPGDWEPRTRMPTAPEGPRYVESNSAIVSEMADEIAQMEKRYASLFEEMKELNEALWRIVKNDVR